MGGDGLGAWECATGVDEFSVQVRGWGLGELGAFRLGLPLLCRNTTLPLQMAEFMAC
jgi:hypothetical protein